MNGLGINFDKSSITQLKSQFDSLIKELESKGKIKLTTNVIETKQELASISGDFNKIIQQYEKLGKVSPPKMFYDKEGNLSKFIVELEQAEGVIDKITLKANSFQSGKNGSLIPLSYGVDNISETDNRLKILEQTKTQISKLENEITQAEEKELAQQKKDRENYVNWWIQEEDKLENAMANGREKANLKYSDSSSQEEINQVKAINKALEEQYQERLKEQQRIQGLGNFKTNVDTNLFDKSTKDISKYIESLYGANAEVTNLKKSTDALGNSTVSATVKTKSGSKSFSEEKVILDQTTNSMYKQNESLKQNTSSMHGFGMSLKMAFQSLASFASMTAVFYGAINQFKEALSFVNSINKSQTNIQMIGGYSRDQVQGLTKDFSNLADELYTTTDSIMSASEEFLRAGNSIEETRSLLQASSIGSAISGQSNADMSEQLIAISNGFKMATSDAKQMMSVIDTLSTLDNNSATSMAEISNALTKTASSAQMAGVSFEDLSTYIATVSSVTRKSSSSIGESFNVGGLVA
jgi:hypothetical protein